MLSEPLAIDVDHQNLDGVPTLFVQLLELFGTRFDRFPADGAARYAHRFSHLRQHFVVLARRNAAQQRTEHVLAETAVLTQGFVGGNLHFAFGLVAEARPLQFYLAVRQFDIARLRSMVPDVAVGLAGGAGAGHLFGAQHQDRLEHLVSDLMDHVLDNLAGILDQVDDRKQNLSVGLAELLDYGGRFMCGTGHDMVRFLHGGRLLSVFCVWQPDSIETGANRRLPTCN